MRYSTKQLKHDLVVMNRRLHLKSNNPYGIRKHYHNAITLSTQNTSNDIGKIIIANTPDVSIAILPDEPFPNHLLRQALPQPNTKIINDLKKIFTKYQNWYFDH